MAWFLINDFLFNSNSLKFAEFYSTVDGEMGICFELIDEETKLVPFENEKDRQEAMNKIFSALREKEG